MARYCPLFSGSSGNCTYIGTGSGGILIDAGVSAKRIETALRERQIEPSSIHAIFVTHEHDDHIRGLRVFAKRYGCAVYATRGTLEALFQQDQVDPGTACHALNGTGVEAAGMWVTSFGTPHDSRESCGYVIHMPDERKIAVVTDIGHVTDTIRQAILGCDLVHLESNHDIDMLRNGRYPLFLKQRILAKTGHLSNIDCATQLCWLVQNGTTRFVLSHLSKENNTPALAFRTATAALDRLSLKNGVDYLLQVAAPAATCGVMVF